MNPLKFKLYKILKFIDNKIFSTLNLQNHKETIIQCAQINETYPTLEPFILQHLRNQDLKVVSQISMSCPLFQPPTTYNSQWSFTIATTTLIINLLHTTSYNVPTLSTWGGATKKINKVLKSLNHQDIINLNRITYKDIMCMGTKFLSFLLCMAMAHALPLQRWWCLT